MTATLAVLALLLALAAVVLAVLALRKVKAEERRRQDLQDAAADLPVDARALRQEVAALRAEAKSSLKHLAVVRYDAFGDMGGHLSWSLALLDDHGDGTVLTSIHGRNEARSYAKTVSGWTSEAQLSPEELEAISNAKP